jgi:ATP:corrinoid adenosyltransferase
VVLGTIFEIAETGKKIEIMQIIKTKELAKTKSLKLISSGKKST